MKRFLNIFIAIIASHIAFAQSDSVQTKNNTIDHITELYKAQDYQSVITICEDVLAKGQKSGELYYNLGNAYFKNGNLPKAIVNYERAVLLKPNDSDIQHNLAFAYNQQPDNIEHISLGFLPQVYQKIYRLLNVDTWAILEIIFLILVCVSFCIFLFSQTLSIRKVALVGMICGALFCVCTFCFAQSRYHELTAHEYAIIIEPTTTLKTEPITTAMDLATIHGGIKVKIIEEAFGWYKVALGNGKEGWLIAENIERI